MLQSIRSFFRAVPTPLAGLALGIASLGMGLEKSLPLHNLGQVLGALTSMTLTLLLAGKFAFNPGLLVEELRHPVLGSILPTTAMALMLQSKSLSIVDARAAQYLWLFAVALHLCLLLAFVRFRIGQFRLHQMVPSWFVPFVGISVAAMTVPGPAYYSLAYGLMLFGMVSYAALLPVMWYRLIFASQIDDAFKPTIAILAAPASLSLVAYLSLEPAPSLLLCSLLLGIAVLMTSIIYVAFFKLLRLPFSPGFAAYTFPMAVGASALYKVSDLLAAYPAALEYSLQLKFFAVLEMIVATLVVAYVCCRYLIFYVRAWDTLSRAQKAARIHVASARTARAAHV
ncbi:TDT family transporter [Desulfovibrio desulfuricans]|uniref:TDT family transporter n=1 Tax=Desulfovibrio desulfuricans TaxID=876 RepID=A0A4P7UJH9_DESDE|nr:TDT family transporter [Desulfovibrio desulfuricans]QCC86626.1 TDT family transporter [Desulfovibrio desulfuricans]